MMVMMMMMMMMITMMIMMMMTVSLIMIMEAGLPTPFYRVLLCSLEHPTNNHRHDHLGDNNNDRTDDDIMVMIIPIMIIMVMIMIMWGDMGHSSMATLCPPPGTKREVRAWRALWMSGCRLWSAPGL